MEQSSPFPTSPKHIVFVMLSMLNAVVYILSVKCSRIIKATCVETEMACLSASGQKPSLWLINYAFTDYKMNKKTNTNT